MNAKKKAQAKKDFHSNYDKEKMGMGDGEAGAASKDKGEDEEESRYLETVALAGGGPRYGSSRPSLQGWRKIHAYNGRLDRVFTHCTV